MLEVVFEVNLVLLLAHFELNVELERFVLLAVNSALLAGAFLPDLRCFRCLPLLAIFDFGVP